MDVKRGDRPERDRIIKAPLYATGANTFYWVQNAKKNAIKLGDETALGEK